jgi:S-formylglutathione hydrolase FrmB
MCKVAPLLLLLAMLFASPGPAVGAETPIPGFTLAARGADGGTVWQGPIPNREVPSDRRPSAIYLPPGFTRGSRYPVLYVLHGMPGSPSSLWDSLHFAAVADEAIAAGKAVPFVAVMPYGGPRTDQKDGEWAGIWARFVADDVVPWTDSQLPTIASRAGRAIAGLSAGGFGALDIGLQHPTLFSTIESWDGYFHPLRDGPFAHASVAMLAANDPTLLVQKEAARLRVGRVRFFLSTGYGHGSVPESAAFDYGALLQRLGLVHEVWLLPRAELGHFWSAQLPAAIDYAESPVPPTR